MNSNTATRIRQVSTKLFYTSYLVEDSWSHHTEFDVASLLRHLKDSKHSYSHTEAQEALS